MNPSKYEGESKRRKTAETPLGQKGEEDSN